ncbi:MAG: ribosomal protein S18-alanine N-acetyltransferase [Porticoccaceae bacterium]
MTAAVGAVHVRQMSAEDLEAVLEIEQGNAKHAWNEKQVRDALHCTQVLVINEKVVGFVALLVIVDQAEVQNISIHIDYQLLGYGEYLLTHAIKNLTDGVSKVYLEVRVSNFSAIRLYNKTGFTEVGQRRGYYPTEFGREDALLMCLAIS